MDAKLIEKIKKKFNIKMPSYINRILPYVQDYIDAERVTRCPQIAQNVTPTVCQQAAETVIPDWTPFRDRALRTAVGECVSEIQPYVECQCRNLTWNPSDQC
jgi:hypothetical protein